MFKKKCFKCLLIQCIQFLFFIFFALGANARDYARWRFAGAFPVAARQKEMRAQMRQQAHQSPNAHRRVLGAYSLVVIHFFSSDYNAEILSRSKKVVLLFFLFKVQPLITAAS